MTEPTTVTTIAPLFRILEHKVLPWAQDDSTQRVVVARETYREMVAQPNRTSLPDGVRVTARRRRGPQLVAREALHYGNRSLVAARWPADRQEAVRFPHILCVIGGEADLHLGDYVLHCPEGHFVFLPAGVPQSDISCPHLEGVADESRSCDVLWLLPLPAAQSGVDCWICHSQGARHWNKDAGEFAFVLDEAAVFYIQAMVAEAARRREGHEEICRCLLTAMLLGLRREFKAGQFFVSGRSSREISAPVDIHDPIAQAQEYIRSHLNQRLTIDGVADAVHVSRASFTQRFRRSTGKSFNAFVTEHRLEEAKRLLRESDWPIRTIGDFVGFKPSQFRNAFQRDTAMSPTVFRRRTRNP